MNLKNNTALAALMQAKRYGAQVREMEELGLLADQNRIFNAWCRFAQELLGTGLVVEAMDWFRIGYDETVWSFVREGLGGAQTR